MAEFGRRGWTNPRESSWDPRRIEADRGGRSWGRRPPRVLLVGLAELWGEEKVCWSEWRSGVLFIAGIREVPENGEIPASDYGGAESQQMIRRCRQLSIRPPALFKA